MFAKGERVKILAGPLQGFAALHTGLSAAEKEILLIGMLGAQRRIAVPDTWSRRDKRETAHGSSGTRRAA